MKERIYYPVTSGQMIMFYTAKFSPRKQITNVCATINITTPLDEALLCQALTMAVMRFPTLNCRLTMQGEKIVQYFDDEFPTNLRLVDMSDKSEAEIQAQINEWSAEPFPNKNMDVPLWRIHVLRMPDGTHSLYFCVCHMVMDAYAMMSCVKYMADVYHALQDGQPIPAIKATPLECYKNDYAYFTGPRYARDTQWWNDQFATEPMYTSLNGRKSKDFVRGKRYGVTLHPAKTVADHLNLRIPKESVGQANQLAALLEVSPQCVYTMAVRSYLAAVSETDDVTLISAVARRATLAQKYGGGTMVNAIPLRTIYPASTSLREGMEIVHRAQSGIFRHADFPCGQILQDLAKRYNVPMSALSLHGYVTVSMTYQPYFSFDDTGFKCTFKREKTGTAATPLYMSIMPYDGSGDLWVNYDYLVDRLSPETLEKLHNFMLRFFEKGLAQPDLTLAELTEQCL